MEESHQCKEKKLVAKDQILEAVSTRRKIQIGWAGCYVLIMTAPPMAGIFIGMREKSVCAHTFFLFGCCKIFALLCNFYRMSIQILRAFL